jgi:hypothetical protein
MPAKEIKELRQSGRLEEAYVMAKEELEADSTSIWGKRNLSWVLYSQLDTVTSDLDSFLLKINEVKELDLPKSEDMFFENISIVISKAARSITQDKTVDLNKIHRLFDVIKDIPINRNSKWYSVLYNSMHKGMKDSNRYLEFADWWDFKNLRPEDYQKEKLPNGKEVMALAEKAYIAYAKHLLPKQNQYGEVIFNKEKAESFLPKLSKIVDQYSQFQYPAYFNAKLLLALNEKQNMLKLLLPFARKKRNDFWVWEILAEAFSEDTDKVFACYCKALSCKSPEEMLVNLRQKMAKILITRNSYNEAKTEIDLLITARQGHKFNIPAEVLNWQEADWYKTAIASKSNIEFYKNYLFLAESILFNDILEESVIVEFVNSDKKILNFIASERKYGFFKYDRFLNNVKIGDTLSVRFQDGQKDGLYHILTLEKTDDKEQKQLFTKAVLGSIKISEGKTFGFIEDIYVHPSFIEKNNLVNGDLIGADAIKTYNKDKGVWTWKIIRCNKIKANRIYPIPPEEYA